MSNAIEFTARAAAGMPNFGLFCVVEVPNAAIQLQQKSPVGSKLLSN